MKNEKRQVSEIENELFQRYPQLECCRKSIEESYNAMLTCFKSEGKLLLAGNGGSASDSEHISGELNKSFYFNRALDPSFVKEMGERYGDEGRDLTKYLEGALPAIPLVSLIASNTAFSNDAEPRAAFAQLVYSLGRKGDIFLGISTSGNSDNIIKALMAAKCRGLRTIALTGKTGGRCKDYADICICAPETETFKIQELHLPIYHALCLMIESAIFQPK